MAANEIIQEELKKLFKEEEKGTGFNPATAKQKYPEAWNCLVKKATAAGFNQDNNEEVSVLNFLHNIFCEKLFISEKLIIAAALGVNVSKWNTNEDLKRHLLDHQTNLEIDNLALLSPDGVLTERRKELLKRWDILLSFYGDIETTPPSDSTLRNNREPLAIESFVSKILSSSQTQTNKKLVGKVLVFGAAAIDVRFYLKDSDLPKPDTCTPAESIVVSPGGKGLAQSIALSRMGFEVYLATIVGGKIFDNRLVPNFLEKENENEIGYINTSLIVSDKNIMTPVTGMAILKDKGTSVVYNKRESESQNIYTTSFVDDCFNKCNLSEIDFIFITYELSSSIIEHILNKIDKNRYPNLKVIVTPVPPQTDSISSFNFNVVDYYVANIWEAQILAEFVDNDVVKEFTIEFKDAILNTNLSELPCDDNDKTILLDFLNVDNNKKLLSNFFNDDNLTKLATELLTYGNIKKGFLELSCDDNIKYILSKLLTDRYIKKLANELLEDSMQNVCILSKDEINIISKNNANLKTPIDKNKNQNKKRDNIAERDTFCAALAYCLKTNNGTLSEVEHMEFIKKAMRLSAMGTTNDNAISAGYLSMPTIIKVLEQYIEMPKSDWLANQTCKWLTKQTNNTSQPKPEVTQDITPQNRMS